MSVSENFKSLQKLVLIIVELDNKMFRNHKILYEPFTSIKPSFLNLSQFVQNFIKLRKMASIQTRLFRIFRTLLVELTNHRGRNCVYKFSIFVKLWRNLISNFVLHISKCHVIKSRRNYRESSPLWPITSLMKNLCHSSIPSYK